MNSNNNIEQTKNYLPEVNSDDAAAVDEFIKQLEAKERDLDISSEMVIEIDDGNFDDSNPAVFVKEQAEIKIPKPENISELHNSIPPNNSFNTLDGEKIRLREQVAKLEADCAILTESLRRRQNDFDNFKSRIERERNEIFQNQISNLASQMLPVLDNLNRALDSAETHIEDKNDDFHQFYQGIVLVNQQLNEVLAEMGVSPVETIGTVFDPHFHEAVATEENESHPPNTIMEEFLRGYRMGEKLIRAAMVKVSVHPQKISKNIESEDGLKGDQLFEIN